MAMPKASKSLIMLGMLVPYYIPMVVSWLGDWVFVDRTLTLLMITKSVIGVARTCQLARLLTRLAQLPHLWKQVDHMETDARTS